MLADHLSSRAELLGALVAVAAVAAGDHVVQADAVAGLEERHLCTHADDGARHLVAQRQRQGTSRRDAGTVVHIRMADACSPDAHQHICRADSWDRHFLQLKWLAYFRRDVRLAWGLAWEARFRQTSEVTEDLGSRYACDDTTSEVFRDLGGLSEKDAYFFSGGMVTVSE